MKREASMPLCYVGGRNWPPRNEKKSPRKISKLFQNYENICITIFQNCLKKIEWLFLNFRVRQKKPPTKSMIRNAITTRTHSVLIASLQAGTTTPTGAPEVMTLVNRNLDLAKTEMDPRQAESFFTFLHRVQRGCTDAKMPEMPECRCQKCQSSHARNCQKIMNHAVGIPKHEIHEVIDIFHYKMKPIHFAEFMFTNGHWIEK